MAAIPQLSDHTSKVLRQRLRQRSILPAPLKTPARSAVPRTRHFLLAPSPAVLTETSVKVKAADTKSLESLVTEAPADSEEVIIKLNVKHHAVFGQVIKVVGAAPALGSWDAKSALALQWTEGDHWVGELRLPAGKYEFKAVAYDVASGHAEWENGANHVLEVPSFPGVLEVDQVWNSASLTTRFTDVPRPHVVDPIELAAQHAAALACEEAEAAAANAAVAEAKLASLRKTIQDDVQRLRTSDEPAAFSQPPAAEELTPASAPGPSETALATPAPLAPPAAAKEEEGPAAGAPSEAVTAATPEVLSAVPKAPAGEDVIAPIDEVDEADKSIEALPPVAAVAAAMEIEIPQVDDATTTTTAAAPAAPVPPPEEAEKKEEIPAVAATAAEASSSPEPTPAPAPAPAPVTPVTANNVVPAPPGVSEASNGVSKPAAAPAAAAAAPRKAAHLGGPALVGDLAETPAGKALNELWGFLANGGRK